MAAFNQPSVPKHFCRLQRSLVHEYLNSQREICIDMLNVCTHPLCGKLKPLFKDQNRQECPELDTCPGILAFTLYLGRENNPGHFYPFGLEILLALFYQTGL